MTGAVSLAPPGAQWLPSEYMDEELPPLRDTPRDWVTRLDDGAYALAGPGWDDDDERGELLKNGDVVPFEWCVLGGRHEWTETGWSPALPPEPPGTSGWMAQIDFSPVMMRDEQEIDPGTSVQTYCWSQDAVVFVFKDGELLPREAA